MPCWRWWKRSGQRRVFRGSLRRRLALAFVLVSILTLMMAFGVMAHMGVLVEHHRWSMRVVPAALAVAAFAGMFSAGLITRRLSRLTAAVERLDLHDLSPRVPVEGTDEVATLARAFNHMVDRLEAEERARRQLFADVAHELRHPLMVLKGRLEMMQDGVVPVNPEQVLNLQDQVITLSRLVGDLRDLSLAEVGGLSLHLRPISLGELVADVQEYLEPVAADKGIRLVAEAAPHLPPIAADADRMQQVLVNLLTNALQHTPQGGEVAIRAWADARGVLVEVADTGSGIGPEDLPHIFDRFYRADKARSRATPGSGLGLAIVRSLVQLHGGSISAESQLGQGSRFLIMLPLLDARP